MANQIIKLSVSSLWCEEVKVVLFTLTNTYECPVPWAVSLTIKINNYCEITKYSRGLRSKQQLGQPLEINNKECFRCQ